MSAFPAGRGLSRRGKNERKERDSLLSLSFASSWETSASREVSARLLMIKLKHNNVKVVADSRVEDVTKIFVFKVSRHSKTRNNKSNSSGSSSTGLPFAQTSARNMLGVPSSHLKSSTFPSSGVCTDGGIDRRTGYDDVLTLTVH